MFKNSKMNKLAMGAHALATSLMLQTQAFANNLNFDSVQVKDNVNVADTMGKIIGLIIFAFRFVGAGMAIYGIVQIVQTLNENNGDARQKGIITLISGIVLAGLPSVLRAFGIIA